MKVFSIPVKVHLSFFVMSVILGMGGGSDLALTIVWVGVVFVSVLFHELGHAFVAKAFGFAPSIQLYAMGGLTSWSSTKEVSPARSILISLAGPGAGFLFGVAVLFVGTLAGIQPLRGPDASLEQSAVTYLLYVNFAWGFLNLIPMLPLDGGNVALSVEEWITGKKDGMASRILSFLLALSVAIWALIAGQIWILFLAGMFSFDNGRVLYKLFQLRRDRSLRPVIDSAWDAIRGKQGAKAIEIAQQVIKPGVSAETEVEAIQILIHGYLEEGRFEQAREELRRLQARFGPSPYLEGLVLLESGDAQQAIVLLEPAFKAEPSAWIGLLLGQAFTKAGRHEEAMSLAANPALTEVASQLYLAIESEAFRTGEYEISARAGQLLYQRTGDPAAAYNVGCALVRMNRNDEALQWIGRSVKGGFADEGMLRADPDLAPLRMLPEFEQLYSKT
jgi:Zn-dependent protease